MMVEKLTLTLQSQKAILEAVHRYQHAWMPAARRVPMPICFYMAFLQSANATMTLSPD